MGFKPSQLAIAVALGLIIYLLELPEIKTTFNATQFVREKPHEQDPVSCGEMPMFSVFTVLLILVRLVVDRAW